MLLRLWSTEFDPDRRDDLEAFAAGVSKPMFDDFEGCLGVAFAARGVRWLTLTLWTDQAALDAAESSPVYQDVVAAILALDVLRGHSSTEVLDVSGWHFEGKGD